MTSYLGNESPDEKNLTVLKYFFRLYYVANIRSKLSTTILEIPEKRDLDMRDATGLVQFWQLAFHCHCRFVPRHPILCPLDWQQCQEDWTVPGANPLLHIQLTCLSGRRDKLAVAFQSSHSVKEKSHSIVPSWLLAQWLPAEFELYSNFELKFFFQIFSNFFSKTFNFF